MCASLGVLVSLSTHVATYRVLYVVSLKLKCANLHGFFHDIVAYSFVTCARIAVITGHILEYINL